MQFCEKAKEMGAEFCGILFAPHYLSQKKYCFWRRFSSGLLAENTGCSV